MLEKSDPMFVIPNELMGSLKEFKDDGENGHLPCKYEPQGFVLWMFHFEISIRKHHLDAKAS